jgi:hypothetical protein
MKMKRVVGVLALFCGWSASAAVVNWGPSLTLSTDSDVATRGDLLYACNTEGGSNIRTVNGVPFDPKETVVTTDGNLSLSVDWGGTSFINGGAPFDNLSSAYKALMQWGGFKGGSQITLNNLTVGRKYLVQVWSCNSRGSQGAGVSTLVDGVVSLDHNSSDADGGVGQTAVGSFSADAAVQTLSFSGIGGDSIVNAIQVRDITPTIYHVDAANTTPVYPYTNWVSAATNIQDAVDAAAEWDIVLVTNGVYDAGQRERSPGVGFNRVMVTKNISLQSVNGPEVTLIVGAPDSATSGAGSNAVRCVYMTDGLISGFTLTNGYTGTSGDVGKDQSGGGINLINHNSGVVSNCVIMGNSAYRYGGGVAYGRATHCTVTDNFSQGSGGGFYITIATNCVVASNEADQYGGGASGGLYYNSSFRHNRASHGAGVMEGMLYNCTVAGNISSGWAGGTFRSTAQNSIVWANQAQVYDNYYEGQFHYSCTTPLATGYDNIDQDPQLLDFVHISETSPCIGAGVTNDVFSDNLLAQTIDIDGESWAYPPSMGCDEIHAGSATGSLQVAIDAPVVLAVEGSTLDFAADIEGRTTSNVWNFDGLSISNQSSISHTWTTAGIYDVELRAFNDDWPLGVASTVTVTIVDMASVNTHYVDAGNSTPAWPFDSWATAATTIQDAVDAAEATGMVGARVWVTNGVYETGTRALDGYTSLNRVLIEADITVQSVNGPEVTTIVGAEGFDGANGPGAVRCAYMLAGTISGFTLADGHTLEEGSNATREKAGGGINAYEGSDVVISNCFVTGCSADYMGGGIFGGAVYDSVISSNTSTFVGGGIGICSTVQNSTLTYNSAQIGGGSYYSDIEHSVISGNTASEDGGGVRDGTVRNTVLSFNQAGDEGGGAYGGTFYNCVLSHNRADIGGGAERGLGLSLYGCSITDNVATNGAGGVEDGTLEHCTVVRNQSEASAGAVRSCTVNSSILWDNASTVGSNSIENCTVSYSCATPLQAGTGNIDANPQLVGASYIAAWSPCIGAAQNVSLSYADIDGEAWNVPPSMGCDEVHAGSLTGSLSVAISAANNQVLEGTTLEFEALIDGRASSSSWSFGDGSEALDAIQVNHAWGSAGSYEVILRVANDDWPLGVAATTTITVLSLEGHGTYHVDAANVSPAWPYLSWATAATNIQDAVDASASRLPGGQVLVTNGVYASGAHPTPGYASTNRVVITNLVSVMSVNGPEDTVIAGSTNGVRCVYMNNGALSGFTLTNGYTSASGDLDYDQSGGGVNSYPGGVMVSNCVFVDCFAANQGGGLNSGTVYDSVFVDNSAVHGGGVYGATLTGCELLENWASGSGGGAMESDLMGSLVAGNNSISGGGLRDSVAIDCVISNNAASHGGGAYNSSLFSSIIVTNIATDGGGTYNGTASNCVITLNHANSDGGGAFRGTLYDCEVSTNTAGDEGGGMRGWGHAYRCDFIGNTAGDQGGGTRTVDVDACRYMGNSAKEGGGMFAASATNSLFHGNHATGFGGAAAYMDLINCTVAYNTSDSESGGAFMTVHSDIENTIIYHNTASINPDLNPIDSIHHSCVPITVAGTGNLTNAPLFKAIDDFHLSVLSPCINAGDNTKMVEAADLEGNARIYDAVVDMGVYEAFDDGTDYDGDTLTDYAEGVTHGSNPWKTDTDGDGSDDGDEWFIGSDLLDSNSVFAVSIASVTTNQLTFSWPIFNAGLRYDLMGRTNLVEGSWIFIGTTTSSNLVRSADDDAMFYQIEVITND